MKIIFEDNPEANLSKLLLYAYDEGCDVKNTPLVFSLGDKNIIRCLQEVRETCIVFVDVVPDNVRTVEEYRKCDKWRKEEKRSNISLIPIPCIEYYAIKSFIGETTDAATSVLTRQAYKDVTVNDRKKRLSVASYERYCKSVLYNHRDCMDTAGSFYMVDCFCAKKSRPHDCIEYKRLEKAWDLLQSLPAIIYHERSTRKTVGTIIGADLENEMVRKYYELAKSFLRAGYISEIQTLEWSAGIVPSIV